jgi:hypothetical protein
MWSSCPITFLNAARLGINHEELSIEALLVGASCSGTGQDWRGDVQFPGRETLKLDY